RGEPSAAVAARVAEARRRARDRGVRVNAELSGEDLATLAPLTPAAERRLEAALERGRLSARGLRRVWAVSLTLADLAGHEPPLGDESVEMALSLRDDPLRHLAGHHPESGVRRAG